MKSQFSIGYVHNVDEVRIDHVDEKSNHQGNANGKVPIWSKICVWTRPNFNPFGHISVDCQSDEPRNNFQVNCNSSRVRETCFSNFTITHFKNGLNVYILSSAPDIH